jgi:hypothetical protein
LVLAAGLSDCTADPIATPPNGQTRIVVAILFDQVLTSPRRSLKSSPQSRKVVTFAASVNFTFPDEHGLPATVTSISEPNARAKTVVVLGLARSGTSVVTGMLKILGVDMGPSTDGQSNPRGSNEDRDFAKLHGEIFKLTGAGKDYWHPPSNEEIRAIAPKIDRSVRALLEEKAQGKTLWGWKHTRTLLTHDLFLPHLVNPYFVLVFRNFLGTALSSVEHTRRRPKPLSFAEALRLVHLYHGEMLRFVETHPQIPAHFIAYEDVILDPLSEANKLAGFLGVSMTEDIGRQVCELVIPRDRLPAEKRRMRSFLHGKLPRMLRRWSGS